MHVNKLPPFLVKSTSLLVLRLFTWGQATGPYNTNTCLPDFPSPCHLCGHTSLRMVDSGDLCSREVWVMATVRWGWQAVRYHIGYQNHRLFWESDENCELSLQKQGINKYHVNKKLYNLTFPETHSWLIIPDWEVWCSFFLTHLLPVFYSWFM